MTTRNHATWVRTLGLGAACALLGFGAVWLAGTRGAPDASGTPGAPGTQDEARASVGQVAENTPGVTATRPGPRPALESATALETATAPAGEGGAVFRPRTGGMAPPPAYAPRDSAEWQGMLIDMNNLQTGCEQTSQCGLAMACVQGRCGPCDADEQCAAGEVCVLQHCVHEPLAACRGRADCSGGALCTLTGYTAEPRGNAEMRAICESDGDTHARLVAERERAEAQQQEQQPDDRPSPRTLSIELHESVTAAARDLVAADARSSGEPSR